MCLRLATAPSLSFWGRSFDLMDLIPAQICTTSWEAWFQMESDNMLKHLKAEQKNWTWMAEVCDSNGSEHLCSSHISVSTFLIIWEKF